MPDTTVKPNHIYLAGLHPVEESFVWEEFQRHPIPGWEIAVLESNTKLPADLTSGEAILVVGCANVRPLNHTETLRRLKLFMNARVWVAVAFDSQRVTQEMCIAAGAAGYFARPINTTQLRETIQQAIPHVGRSSGAFTCARIIYHGMIFRSNVCFRFQTREGVTGTVVMRNGHPIHARLSNGVEGLLAMRNIMEWGSAKVFCLAIPDEVVPNLPIHADADAAVETDVAEMVDFAPCEMISGATVVCDRLSQNLAQAQVCVVVDLEQRRVVGCPSLDELSADEGKSLVEATIGLMQAPRFDEHGERQRIDDVVIATRDGWCAMFALGVGALVAVVAARGQSQSVLARSILLEAIHDGLLNEKSAEPAKIVPPRTAQRLPSSPIQRTAQVRERETIYQ